jgi:hypothetical protein
VIMQLSERMSAFAAAGRGLEGSGASRNPVSSMRQQ